MERCVILVKYVILKEFSRVPPISGYVEDRCKYFCFIKPIISRKNNTQSTITNEFLKGWLTLSEIEDIPTTTLVYNGHCQCIYRRCTDEILRGYPGKPMYFCSLSPASDFPSVQIYYAIIM